jgi:hypothetical protein
MDAGGRLVGLGFGPTAGTRRQRCRPAARHGGGQSCRQRGPCRVLAAAISARAEHIEVERTGSLSPLPRFGGKWFRPETLPSTIRSCVA